MRKIDISLIPPRKPLWEKSGIDICTCIILSHWKPFMRHRIKNSYSYEFNWDINYKQISFPNHKVWNLATNNYNRSFTCELKVRMYLVQPSSSLNILYKLYYISIILILSYANCKFHPSWTGREIRQKKTKLTVTIYLLVAVNIHAASTNSVWSIKTPRSF